MMPVELSRMSRSADAMGPFGSRTPSEQPPSVAAPINETMSARYGISTPLWFGLGGTAAAERNIYRPDRGWSGVRGDHEWPTSPTIVSQESCEQHKQVQDRKREQAICGPALGLAARDHSQRECNERRPGDGGGRAIDNAGKP